jgi:hypothetical protein
MTLILQLFAFLRIVIMLSHLRLSRGGFSAFAFGSTLASTRGGNSSLLSTSTVGINADPAVVKLSEKTVFQGYRNIIRREYQLPSGKQASFDILTQKHLSVVVFTWNTTDSTTTLIREYHPGAEKFMYGAVAGMYESSKHLSPLHASVLELEEEAQLRAESHNWIPLLDTQDTSMSFDKYSTNRFFPFLALDCTFVANARPMDDEELITVERAVPYSRMMQLLTSGEMNVVSSYAILLGVKKLREMGIKVE